ncbi:uncharacterized protein K02A2.6-like [Teleopsis dalmanni]|uniref:uncharacterized protein K02A2.6-like n=1 Tax=Teleopsis dalmanni TaxID=139649 RepID=UPI0018CD1FA5|nr:uncharacterized protein K02A2.6-like [Teleopsis dalmanni]
MVHVKIDGKEIQMELDTGAPCAVISYRTLRSIRPNCKLLKSDRRFTSYTGHKVNCVGRIVVSASVGKIVRRLSLYVVEGDCDTLCGREWISQFARENNFSEFFSSSNHINSINSSERELSTNQRERLQQLIERFKNVFSETAGKLSGPPAKVHLKKGATPVFARPREVPMALKDAYGKEIDRKIQLGHYKRVDHSEWASITHIVAKKNGGIRITGNYKPTVNPQMIIDEHPIPKAEDLFNKMKNATIFCHLDVTDAYTHLTIDEEFAHVLTLNTITHGLVRPTRAVYGAANIPAIWQRRMETVLHGMANVLNFFDDILVYAKNFDELLQVLETILGRIQLSGLRLNKSKCVFATTSVEFLGHRIDAHGVYKSQKHVEAILNAPKPSMVEELQLFLGKATYYGAFIPDLATKARPLRDMLKTKEFCWTGEADAAFTQLKQILTSPQVLIPYDPSLPVMLATDASRTGLGAVLSHHLENGVDRPIVYASRTMTATEQRYTQIDKEALAIVWAVQKFFKYLYARHWILITDHKPLSQILQPNKSLPVLCISRMANYAEFLSRFDFEVIYKNSKANANADYLSRASLQQINQLQQIVATHSDECDEFDNFMICQINQLPVKAERIAIETRKDEHLGKIIRILESGRCLKREGYKSSEASYVLSSGCLTFEHRVVIPPHYRQRLLENLHTSHLGMVKMKGIARSFIYWPGIDKDIENMANECDGCARQANKPVKCDIHHWEYPKGPWERIHIDYAGPFEGAMLLVIVDAYSKWLRLGDLHYEILFNGKEVKRHSSGDNTKDSLEAENNESTTEGSPGLENEFERPENNEATTEGSPGLENEFERWTTPNTSRNEEFYSTPHPIAESTPETTNVTPDVRRSTRLRKTRVCYTP